MKRAAFFVAALLIGGAARADKVVGNLSRASVTNGMLDETLVAAPLASSIDKIGAGTYSLSAEQVLARSELGVNVHQGTLAFSDAGGEIPSVTEPPAVMDAAVLWLEASTNVVADADGYVTKWYDVRETQSAGMWGATRYRGVAAVIADIEGATNPVMRVNAAGQPMVYFNGKKSGSYMMFQKPNGASVEDIGGIYHVFQVLCISNSLGYALGNRSSADGIAYFHPQNTDGTLGCYLDPNGTVDPSVSGGRAYLDGVYTDMAATSATPGMHLTEYQITGARAAKVGRFFCDRGMGGGTYKRSGGDYIGEVVLFTNRLDEADRLAVGEYLLKKWVSPVPHVPMSVRTASNTVAQVSADAGVTTAPIRMMGAGTFVKDGAGTVALVAPAYGSGEAAEVRVDAGDVRTELAVVDVAVRAGDAYAKAGVDGNARRISRAAAPAGEFSVSGGVWRVSEVPAGVKKLTATADELVLAGGTREAGFNVAPGVIEATIPNHSFEKGTVSTVNPGSTTTVEGWTFKAYTKAAVGNTGYDGYVYLQSLPKESDWRVKHPYRAPDGNKVFMGKAGFAAWCTVNVPTGGIYELSFKYCKRGDIGPVGVDFAIVTGTQTNWIGRHYATSLSDFREQRYRTPWLAAGDHVLYFGHVNGTDCLPHYDDFHLRLVPEENVETAPVPNGNFEMARYTGMRLIYNLPITNAWSASNTLDGWTLTQTAAAVNQPSVAPSSRFTPGYFREARAVGDGQLVFSFAGGVATSPAFKLPAGKWRLRCQGTRWCVCNFNFWAWNGTTRVNGTPNLSATMTVNGAGEPVSLGTVSVSSRLPRTYSFGTPITVTAEDELVLSLTQTVDGATVVLDDLEFERVAEGDELVTNGGFASDLGGWVTGTLKNDADSYLKKCNLFRKGNTDINYSYNTCDGNQGLMFVQAAWLEQNIAFPSSGVYRLSFWTSTRYDRSANAGERRAYGGNALEAYLVKDGVTNAIGRTDACLSTNFQHRAYTFSVPAAGTYKFGFRSLNGWPTADGGHILTQPTGHGISFVTSDSHVFLDAISIKPAGALPPPQIDRKVDMRLDASTRLRLDYDGTVEVDRLTLGGRSVVGTVDATHPCGLVYGPGALYIRPKGTVVIFR